ncbi:transcriptional regulator [Sinomonas atrocyanea]|uniref:Transcriptional regulator n=1 Tax=Sinomonas atrocyanea TaxID=37927 RepID=A0A127A4G4_9MICC|nr:SRPBCC family protein [Sinomonas atrocyanea]AMM34319.1 transcriptional regulator [Sinomonas atrocyanea]GEB66404.1 potassium-transporting ATPase subunit F [Sinomonas atrocyanea]GGG63635.1 potassium-transporting ATPase subunit F [Sinomonas atrocyanea]
MAAYTISRSAFIPAPPEAVYPHVVDFHKWADWSPWEALDPAMERTFSGPAAGTGAQYSWRGNRRAGAGTMQILEAEEPRSIRLRLVFVKPFKAVNPTGFTFEPDRGGTRVTWVMKGENRGVAGVVAKLMKVDSMVGKDFEKGLANLARVVAAGR